MQRRLLDAVRNVVPRPATISHITDHCAAEAATILGRDPASLEWGEYQFMLAGNFEAALFYLPYALDYLKTASRVTSDLADSMLIFVSGYARNLRQLGLYDMTLGEFREMFFRWIGRYNAKTVDAEKEASWVILGASVTDGEARDLFLDFALTRRPKEEYSRWVDGIVQAWSDDFGDPCKSAHWIDFCLNIRKPRIGVNYMPRHQPIVQRVFDMPRFERHWQVASDLVTSMCGAEYVEELHKFARGEW